MGGIKTKCITSWFYFILLILRRPGLRHFMAWFTSWDSFGPGPGNHRPARVAAPVKAQARLIDQRAPDGRKSIFYVPSPFCAMSRRRWHIKDWGWRIFNYQRDSDALSRYLKSSIIRVRQDFLLPGLLGAAITPALCGYPRSWRNPSPSGPAPVSSIPTAFRGLPRL